MNSINKSYIRNSGQDLNNFRCTTASTHSALTKSRSLMTKINRPLYEAHPRGLRPTNKAVNKPLFSAPASDHDCNLYRPSRSEDCMWRTHRAVTSVTRWYPDIRFTRSISAEWLDFKLDSVTTDTNPWFTNTQRCFSRATLFGPVLF